MTVRTLDDLSRMLRDDLAWRRKENSFYRTLVRTSEAAKKQAILRGAIAVLYAHWEGFVKAASKAYLDYVRIRRLKHSELSIAFLGMALKLRLKGVKNLEHFDSHRDFADWLLREWTRRAILPRSEDVLGTSNLSVEVFKSFTVGLGLPYGHDFEQAEKPVIEALVMIRNELAHGNWRRIEEDEYEQFYVWTDRLMLLVCDNIENAAITSQYRRALTQIH